MDRLISEFEAIRAIEKYVDNIFTKNMGDLIKDIKAIPSAESQEVIYSDDGYIANCPNCNCVYEIDDLVWGCNYCPHCGQALKWEKE